jgi:transcriptional regulator with XRE-family HTH domain
MDDLWKIRLQKQMSVAQLSARAGIPARLIREYEAGKRSIPMRNLEKLARALFVDVMDIEPLSSPIPSDLVEKTRRPRRESRPRPQPEQAPPSRGRRPSSQGQRRQRGQHDPAPARDTQIEHMLNLAELFEMDRKELEKQIGTPLSQLTRQDASSWLKKLQDRVVEERPTKTKKHRPYLPESVDNFELEYLTEKKENAALIEFTLFDGKEMTGTIIGFGPYSITIESEEDGETTLNKLAIAYYQVIEEEEA